MTSLTQRTAGWKQTILQRNPFARKPPSHEELRGLNAQLLKAAEEGDTRTANALLKKGADPNAQDEHRTTPLTKAAERDDAEMARLLLDRGADIEMSGYALLNPLQRAALHGNTKTMQLLLARGANLHVRDELRGGLLEYATTFGIPRNIEGARLLIDLGLDVNGIGWLGFTPLIRVCMHGGLEFAQMLVEKGADVNLRGEHMASALMHAVGSYNYELVRFLVFEGADLEARDQWGMTALMEAAKPTGTNLEMVKFLVAHKADVNARDNLGGSTALRYACASGALKIARYLLENGADVEAADDFGTTALTSVAGDRELDHRLYHTGNWTYQCGGTHLNLVQELIRHRANVNAQDRWGRTPLLSAVGGDHEHVVYALLQQGADPNITDEEGRTPLVIAMEKSPASAMLLRQFGAIA